MLEDFAELDDAILAELDDAFLAESEPNGEAMSGTSASASNEARSDTTRNPELHKDYELHDTKLAIVHSVPVPAGRKGPFRSSPEDLQALGAWIISPREALHYLSHRHNGIDTVESHAVQAS